MTNRSESANPLTSPPPELPSTSNATTPSIVDTKLAMTVGRSGWSATPSCPSYRSRRPGGSRPPRKLAGEPAAFAGSHNRSSLGRR